MKLISQLSKETGVPIGTIRFYEKTGLFSGEKKKGNATNNYVYYSDEVIKKLTIIKEAKSAGFSLSEIKELISAWYGKRLNKEKKLEILDKKLEQINWKMMELKSVKKQINQFKKEIENNEC